MQVWAELPSYITVLLVPGVKVKELETVPPKFMLPVPDMFMVVPATLDAEYAPLISNDPFIILIFVLRVASVPVVVSALHVNAPLLIFIVDTILVFGFCMTT